ncbi:MAG: SLC13 family permease, partial [Opitutaceae bacterium]|nr:SLC13 family permease [Opitutaceae bacterium]
MTWEIALVLILLAVAFGSFVWEKVTPDVTALGLFAVIALTGLLTPQEAFSVFSNPAPFTVAAMFVMSAALVKCGAIDHLTALVEGASRWSYSLVIAGLVLVVATVSAFINNTPVVVVFLPVVLHLARKMKLAPSKFLIPLSYAAVLGGTCTLIGTSTNLVVDGILRIKGQPSLGMFELAWLGVPATLAGMVYLATCGQRLLPVREMLTSILSEEERREYITEAFVHPKTPAVGKTVTEAGLGKASGTRVLEIVRDGVALNSDLLNLKLEAGDRLVLACRPKGVAATRGVDGIDLISELKIGLEQIAAHEGSLVEAVVNPHADMVGRTVREVNFRQRYRVVVLALHRKGKNVRDQLEQVPIAAGDVLLMMGTDQAIDALRHDMDFVLFDQERLPAKSSTRNIALVLGLIATVVVLETLDWVPIELGALVACLITCATGFLKPKEAYDAIEWPVLFVIFGMLAMGLAMDRTGAAAWVARSLVEWIQYSVPAENKPWVMLAALYLVTVVLTEVLSNNAVAALMIPIVLGIAKELQVDPRPFVIAVAFAASAAFATPIGYQTNTYVYGV